MAKNVLIVDDAAFMRMMIKDILTKNGYTIAAEAENGKIAVDKYNEVKPDLVLIHKIVSVSSGPHTCLEILLFLFSSSFLLPLHLPFPLLPLPPLLFL